MSDIDTSTSDDLVRYRSKRGPKRTAVTQYIRNQPLELPAVVVVTNALAEGLRMDTKRVYRARAALRAELAAVQHPIASAGERARATQDVFGVVFEATPKKPTAKPRGPSESEAEGRAFRTLIRRVGTDRAGRWLQQIDAMCDEIAERLE